jgi:hypothetical protein
LLDLGDEQDAFRALAARIAKHGDRIAEIRHDTQPVVGFTNAWAAGMPVKVTIWGFTNPAAGPVRNDIG